MTPAKLESASSAPQSFPPVEEQLAILLRGVDFGDQQTFEHMSAELRTRLEESRRDGRPLRAYVGIDPTGSDLTLGHTVPLRKLRQLQDLGHHAVFLVGDMTGRIGDPSDKDASRRIQTVDEVDEHARHYVEQSYRVLDPARTEVRRNSEWLAELDFGDVIELASHFTVQQFLQRDNFSRRYARGDAIWLHEFYYALMQAYDALALGTDIQIGGTEQLFNLMAGRKLQELNGQRPQVPLTLPILVGTDGALRMSKTTGNYVGIAEPAETQYGKTMSLPDEAMFNWFELVTTLHPSEIESLRAALESGDLHPMEVKKRLAREIVGLFHGSEAADAAQLRFERTVQGRERPDDLPSYTLTAPVDLVELLVRTGLAGSRSEARRLTDQGGVRLDGVTLSDPAMIFEPGPPRVLQVGKRRFLELV